MLQFLLDTDHLTLYQHGHLPLLQRISAHPAGAVGISPVSMEEALRGRLAPLARPLTGNVHIQAYARLVATVLLFQQFPIAPFDPASEHQFQQLRTLRLRIGTRDLKIAAIALANHLTVLTRNHRDFALVPGILLQDWSQ